MINYTCPKCGQEMTSPDSLVGGFEKCPACGTISKVPRSSPQRLIVSSSLLGRLKRPRVYLPLTGLGMLVIVLLSSSSPETKPSSPKTKARPDTKARRDAEIGRREAATNAASLAPARLTYSVLKVADLSYAGADRAKIRVRVSRELTEADMKWLCQRLLEETSNLRDNDAVCFHFYLPGTRTDGHTTAGQADWAPFGDWGQASRGTPKSDFRFKIRVGGALGEVGSVANMPEQRRREIFRAVVAAQRPIDDKMDRQDYSKPVEEWENFGEEYEQANHQVARKYGISLDDLHKIMGEGVILGWD